MVRIPEQSDASQAGFAVGFSQIDGENKTVTLTARLGAQQNGTDIEPHQQVLIGRGEPAVPTSSQVIIVRETGTRKRATLAASVTGGANGQDRQQSSSGGSHDADAPRIPLGRDGGEPPDGNPPAPSFVEEPERRRIIDNMRRSFTITREEAMQSGDMLRSLIHDIAQRAIESPELAPKDKRNGISGNEYNQAAMLKLSEGIYVLAHSQEGLQEGELSLERLVFYEKISDVPAFREICHYATVPNGPGMRTDADQLHNPIDESSLIGLTSEEAQIRRVEILDANSGFVGVEELADLDVLLSQATPAEIQLDKYDAMPTVWEVSHARDVIERLREGEDPPDKVRITFGNLRFEISRGSTMIPSVETYKHAKTISAAVAEMVENENIQLPIKIADIATGSGILAITLARELQEEIREGKVQIIAGDISARALQDAQLNAYFNNVEGIIFTHADGFGELEEVDIAISNPPNISSSYLNTWGGKAALQFIPQEAFIAGQKGMGFYQKLFEQSQRALSSRGIIIVQHQDFDRENVEAIIYDTRGESVPITAIRGGRQTALVVGNQEWSAIISQHQPGSGE